MSERYTKLFTLKDNLYSEDVPVLISAGALTKDNQTGKVFAQLRLQNTDAKFRNLIALKVSFTSYDPAGNILGVAKEYQYLDLNIPRGSEFGGNKAVALDNPATRSFEVTVLEAVFSEGKPWTGKEQEWVSLGRQKTLDEALGKELAEQYRRDTFSGAKYELYANKGIWKCTCGALNIVGEHACWHCRSNKDVLVRSLDHSILANHLSDYKTEINKQNQQRKAEAEEKRSRKKKAVKKIMLILLPFIILIGSFLGVKSFVAHRQEEALRLEQERLEAELEAEKAALETLLCSDTWVKIKDGETQIRFRFYEGGTGDFANTRKSGDVTWNVVDGDTFEVICPAFTGSYSRLTWHMVQKNGKYSFTTSVHTFYRRCDID